MQSELRGYATCPSCSRITAVRTSARFAIWECLNCGVFFDGDGDVYEPSEFKKEVK